ncbi:MAG: nicotinate-nicotinamide nucleotide adenylyltransferase [Candidatus Poribacteria bacterium]|nr:nicotinate-nicotinamide nucleotide adenylyltransferase [Candidatus Poribacteria bacterium]
MYDAILQRYERLVAGLDVSGQPTLAFTHRARVEPPRRLGVFAASFNPPTLAHVRLPELARERFELDEVVMELAKSNVDKDVSGAPLHERLMMVRLLAESRGWMSVAASTHGRFLDKMDAIRGHFPDAAVYFVVGYDTLVRIFDPKYYVDRNAELADLFRQCAFICANRAEAGLEDVEALMAQTENQAFAGSIHTLVLDDEVASMSSTDARQRLSDEALDAALIDPAVLRYIQDRGLYRSG